MDSATGTGKTQTQKCLHTQEAPSPLTAINYIANCKRIVHNMLHTTNTQFQKSGTPVSCYELHADICLQEGWNSVGSTAHFKQKKIQP